MAPVESYAVGFDFGTSTSMVADRDGADPPDVLPLGRHLRTKYVPSLAALRDGRLIVGEDADLNRADVVIRSIKRAITEERETIEVATTDGPRQIAVDEVVFGILEEVARRAHDHGLALTEQDVVRMGCPAMWTGPQRRRLLAIAERAKLPVTDASLIDEPVAAGVAWLSHRFLAHQDRPEGRLVVFDMGGGTVDVAVLDVVGGQRPDVSVLAALGLAEAGDDLDRAIRSHLLDKLHNQGYQPSSGSAAPDIHGELLRQARTTKVRLSSAAEWTIALDPDDFGGVPSLRYSREDLEDAFGPQMDRAVAIVVAALRAARLSEELAPTTTQLRAMAPDELGRDVKYVLLAGGMSRIPYVTARLGDLLPRAEIHQGVAGPPDEAIVAGLADTFGYDDISLHRPAFDFVLEWDQGRQRRVLYQGYSPLYEPWKVAHGYTFLGHEWHDRYPAVPRDGVGVLRVFSPSGQPISLELEGRPMDGMRVAFGSHEFDFKIYCDGQILITDGSGRRFSARVRRWPVIRGHDHAERLRLTSVADVPDPPVPWYLRDDD